jgi:ribosomal protein L37AE/L43A
MQQVTESQELCETPVPFYVNAAFHRLCQPHWECDYCEFASSEVADEENEDCSGICPESLYCYVAQRQKVKQKFDASHPPVCPACGKRMVADRTITLGDEDVAAFSCNHCHKFERDSRWSIENTRFQLNRNKLKENTTP